MFQESDVTSTIFPWFTIDFESHDESDVKTISDSDDNIKMGSDTSYHFDFYVDPNFQGEIPVNMDDRIREDWISLIESHQKIIVVHIWKLSCLGISLEGTVDVENGVELHPRHFIRSIQPSGPIAKCKKLQV